MTEVQANPLSIATKLFGNPKQKPQFGRKVQLSTGHEIWVGDPRATRAMVALMDMNAQMGGAASHFGGPSAFAELMAALHGLMFHVAELRKAPWHSLFNFINDAGHCENGLYALKANYGLANLDVNALKKFRSIQSALSGHGEAHLFPEGVLISNGPLGSGLPQAQGLAFADALSGRKRTTVCALSDGAAMEGEAKEAFSAIPGFAKRGKMAGFICILSDNKTKLSGRIEDAFSMEPSFQAMRTMGWRVLPLEDGHHLQACTSVMEEALYSIEQDPSQPILIHARTVKGKGHKKSEEAKSGGHGFSLKSAEELPAMLSEIYEGQAVPEVFTGWAQELMAQEAQKKSAPKKAEAMPTEKIQVGISQAMIDARKKGLPVFSISADLPGSTGVADYQKAFPNFSQDVGVAEANMISMAAGLSLGGYIPVVDTFAQFGVTKGALPLTMANLSLAPVIGIFSHTGFQDAADGASHQALSFYAQVSAIPYVDVYALSSSREAYTLLMQAFEKFASDRAKGETPRSQIFFLGRENFPQRFLPEDYKYVLGKAQVVADTSNLGNAVTIVSTGSMLTEALAAAEKLGEKKMGSIVINLSAINHPDLETVRAALKKTSGRLITVEEHRLPCGAGGLLAHALAMAGEKFQIQSLAVGDHFGQSSYTAKELYQKHGIDSDAIIERCLVHFSG